MYSRLYQRFLHSGWSMRQLLINRLIQREEIMSKKLAIFLFETSAKTMGIIKGISNTYIESTKKVPRWHAFTAEKIHDPNAGRTGEYAGIMPPIGYLLTVLAIHYSSSSGCANMSSQPDHLWFINKNRDKGSQCLSSARFMDSACCCQIFIQRPSLEGD